MTGEDYIKTVIMALRQGADKENILLYLRRGGLYETQNQAILASAQKRIARQDADRVVIPNEARRTLDAYERFHSANPCFDPESTDKYKFFNAENCVVSQRDGLWHFSTRP